MTSRVNPSEAEESLASETTKIRGAHSFLPNFKSLTTINPMKFINAKENRIDTASRRRISMTMRASSTLFVAGAFSSPLQAQTLERTAEPFDNVQWQMSDDSSAPGSIKTSSDVAAGLSAQSKTSLRFEADFSGQGLEVFHSVPAASLSIPGVAKKLSLWVRNETLAPWVLQFKDGWGRTQEWRLTDNTDNTDNTWKKVVFNVPTDWVQPVSISGISTHNWDSQTKKETRRISLDQLQVETDLSDVDASTGALKTWIAPNATVDPEKKLPQTAPMTPLLKVNLATSERHNVFAGTRPRFWLNVQNWRSGAATGTLEWKVFDPRNKLVKSGRQSLKVADNLVLPLDVDTRKFGVFRLDATLKSSTRTGVSSSRPFAVVPQPRALTDAEKDASPYGINVHSGRNIMVDTFRKAGIVWFRDYAFDYDWFVRAKGADKSYSAWPNYPRIVRNYQVNGARVLPITKGALKPPADGVPHEPDLTWVREMAELQIAFPELRAFELDNEYDLHGSNSRSENAIAWKNYRNYHKKFGEITHLLSGGKSLAVENGRAGIWPERVREMVQSGDFAQIDVVNSHHYSGTDAPETNVGNHNMGFAGNESVMTFFDQLRAVKKYASMDGKPRQHWLTEFGWDTKAGPVVSAREQAAYLARAYMLLAATGTEKGFWFFDLDEPKATNFFDGTGLFTHESLPKLAFASFAGMTQILPAPQYLGTINEGDRTWGYLFRNEDKLVASLWTLKDEKGPIVNFGNAKVYDYLANPLNQSTVALGLEPTYAVGVSEESRWFRQAAYSLETPLLSLATAGDSVTASLQVRNFRKTAINGKMKLQLPAGWSDTSGEQTVSVAPGQTKQLSFAFRVGTKEELGEEVAHLSISEGELLKTIPLRVQIKRPVVLSVQSLKGEPGNSAVGIRISNGSMQNLDGSLRLKLPSSWSTTTPEIKVPALKPMETREVQAQVQWASTWKEGESASVEYISSDGRTARQPLIPSRMAIYAAPDLVIDGDLKDWPARNKLPDWALGSTQGEANASVFMAWSSKGFHLALDVRDSKAFVPDPKSFWMGDALELFLDTNNRKTTRSFEPGDHQFWLSPMIDQKRVFAGQWKRNGEVSETKYDLLAGAQSVAVRRGNGYVLECLLPASAIKDFKAAPGTRLGLNFNLLVKGLAVDREVFWPLAKSGDALQPAAWGSVTLTQ